MICVLRGIGPRVCARLMILFEQRRFGFCFCSWLNFSIVRHLTLFGASVGPVCVTVDVPNLLS